MSASPTEKCGTQASPLPTQARGVRPYTDDDGFIHLQLLDLDLEPFAEFICDEDLVPVIIARLQNCQEKAAGLPRSDADH